MAIIYIFKILAEWRQVSDGKFDEHIKFWIAETIQKDKQTDTLIYIKDSLLKTWLQFYNNYSVCIIWFNCSDLQWININDNIW